MTTMMLIFCYDGLQKGCWNYQRFVGGPAAPDSALYDVRPPGFSFNPCTLTLDEVEALLTRWAPPPAGSGRRLPPPPFPPPPPPPPLGPPGGPGGPPGRRPPPPPRGP